jgi:large subunit ribosomal protein L25
MATASLSATPRSDTGTGVARKLRQAGQVPGIIYGHGREPQPLVVNSREIEKLLSQINAASTVIELSLDGSVARTLIREIQRHPFKRHLVHVDFQELVAGEKVTVNVPLRFVGIADGVRNAGGILEEVMHQLHIRVDPSAIPDHINVDVTAVTIGHSMHVGDIALPEGVTVLDDEDATVCVVAVPKTVAEPTPAEGVAVVAEGAPEPELIRKPKGEEEEETK